jgi:hypothetical protein
MRMASSVPSYSDSTHHLRLQRIQQTEAPHAGKVAQVTQLLRQITAAGLNAGCSKVPTSNQPLGPPHESLHHWLPGHKLCLQGL